MTQGSPKDPTDPSGTTVRHNENRHSMVCKKEGRNGQSRSKVTVADFFLLRVGILVVMHYVMVLYHMAHREKEGDNHV